MDRTSIAAAVPVVAVILSAAKDPDTEHIIMPVGPVYFKRPSYKKTKQGATDVQSKSHP